MVDGDINRNNHITQIMWKSCIVKEFFYLAED